MASSRPLAALALRAGASLLLFAAIGGAAYYLYLWKQGAQAAAMAAAQAQPEPSEVAEAAPVRLQPYVKTTTAIGTVRALQSISLRNELPGTVRHVHLQTGQVVEKGALLVELDCDVELAELAALEAEARLADTLLGRTERALQSQGASAADVDRARAERDKAAANVARLKAVIERKRIHAPFRARTGIVDLHPGQYLDAGALITNLQGVDDAVHIDFAVPQDLAVLLPVGAKVDVSLAGGAMAAAVVEAIDARVDSATRNTWIRARLGGVPNLPLPGASVRLSAPVAPSRDVVVVPVSALRRGPSGDHVFVLETAADGQTRARQRRVRGGASLGDVVIVTEGLTPGEQVAAAGSFKLREGVLVHVAPQPTAPKAN